MCQATVDAQSSTQFWPRAVGPFITIAWDPSPDPSVIGYVVYVGTESRGYTKAFDVGNRTSFVYPHAIVNKRHFFAVAAYSSAFVPGELSSEVSGFGRLVPPSGYVPDFNITPLGTAGAPSQCVVGVTCLESATVSASARTISAVTSTVEGQVWFVEDNRRIFTIDVDGSVSAVERNSRRNAANVDGVAVDPSFDKNRRIYIQQIDRLPDGSRELTIVRYRQILGTLREPTVIVSGIRLPATGRVPFTVDSDGRVFVAVPRDRNAAQPHEGIVFGVGPDGKYVRGPSGSLSWRGLTNPSGVIWDAASQELWLAGSDATGTAVVERLEVSPATESGRATAKSAPRYLLVPAAGGRLLRIDRYTTRGEAVTLESGDAVTAVSGTGGEVVFAVTRPGTSGSRIVAIPLTD